MSDVQRRIGNLTAARRRLFETLLQAGRPPGQPAAAGTAVSVAGSAASKSQADDEIELFYDRINRALDSSAFGPYSLFLNYGLAADGATTERAASLPAAVLQPNCVRLVLELVGQHDLSGGHLLDTGCGRGGTIETLSGVFQPLSAVGLDLSGEAIAFCLRHHQSAGAYFCQGDAQRLPFADSRFDFVTNVESAHSYPRRADFYAEVRRVLRPGGRFLYADVFVEDGFATEINLLERSGFVLDDERDITPHVVASCDEHAARDLEAFAGHWDGADLGAFLAVPGSPLYDELVSHRRGYRILRLHRDSRIVSSKPSKVLAP